MKGRHGRKYCVGSCPSAWLCVSLYPLIPVYQISTLFSQLDIVKILCILHIERFERSYKYLSLRSGCCAAQPRVARDIGKRAIAA